MPFIPLKDENPIRHIRRQYVTFVLIAACVLVFLWQLSLDPAGQRVMAYAFGLVPAVLFGEAALPPEVAVVPPWLSVVTSMFLHGGWLHLIGNMLFLWVFGDNVEDAMGHGRFIAFYLLTGALGALAHAVGEPSSTVPTIGASGAISGILGAYLVLHPRARVLVLIFFRILLPLPAFTVLGAWIGMQVLEAWLAAGGPAQGGGTAWWAHIGGFAAGAALVPFFRRAGVPLLGRNGPSGPTARTPDEDRDGHAPTHRPRRGRSIIPESRRRDR